MINERILRRRAILHGAGLPSPARSMENAGHPATQARWYRSFPKVSDCLALIATRNFMPYAKLAARSFLAHHPEYQAFLLLVDGEPLDAEAFTEGHVVLPSELSLDHAGWYAAKFTASEFSNALKPAFLRYLAGFAVNAIYL